MSDPTGPGAASDEASKAGGNSAPKGLRSQVIRGSAWTMAEYVFNNILRMITNMIMARLLFPEAFGLMTLANTVIQGLEMFADVGIGLSIVQSKRGDDPDFLNTAWTLQIVRGLLLSLVTFAIAVPYALYYEQPILTHVVPACGLMFIINGLQSTNMATCGRSLNLKRLVILGTAEAVVKSAIMIAWAFLSPSVWALVGGSLITYALSAVASHVMLPGIRNRFRWEPEAARQLIRFGKWVFLSTALTYLAMSSDRLIVAKLAPMAVVGVYGTAFMFSKLPFDVAVKLASQVQYPALTEVFRRDPSRLDAKLSESRGLILAVSQFGIVGIIVVSPAFFALCYDARYAQAAVFAPLLAIAGWISILQASADRALLAVGDARALAFSNAANCVVTLGACVAGHAWLGMPGFIMGVGLGNLAGYAVIVRFLRRHGLRTLMQDFAGSLVIAVAALIGAVAPAELLAPGHGVPLRVLLVLAALLISGAYAYRGVRGLVEPMLRRMLGMNLATAKGGPSA